MFRGCSSLKELPLLDCSSISEYKPMGSSSYGQEFNYSPFCNIVSGCSSLTNIAGFKNLGKGYPTDKHNGYVTVCVVLDLTDCPINKQSLLNIGQNLFNRKSAGYEGNGTILVTLNQQQMLSYTEYQTYFINKGYTLVVN